MKYNWDEIYKSKTNNELIKIFNGGDIHSYDDARISAAKILMERNYDQVKLKRIKEKYIKELNFKINKIQTTDIIKEKKKNTISTFIFSLILCIFFYIMMNPSINLESFTVINLVIYIAMISLIIISTIIGNKRFTKKRIKELEGNLKAIQKIKYSLNIELQI